jgi:hypothetical protein
VDSEWLPQRILSRLAECERCPLAASADHGHQVISIRIRAPTHSSSFSNDEKEDANPEEGTAHICPERYSNHAITRTRNERNLVQPLKLASLLQRCSSGSHQAALRWRNRHPRPCHLSCQQGR